MTAKPEKPRKERKENADMRRRQILDAAFRSIVLHGLARTTLATVANEAELSQGVAVFYFKSKTGILTEAMRDLYRRYETHWYAALKAAGEDPAAQLREVIRADFDPGICNPDTLTVWYAFLGEQKFVQQYAEISEAYETKRLEELQRICQSLAPGQEEHVEFASDWIDRMTDGYWQKLHLFWKPGAGEEATDRALRAAATLFPDHAETLLG